jgi:hypothetical protein
MADQTFDPVQLAWSQPCLPGATSGQRLVNFRVIRVKVVAPEKLLDVNIFPKNTLTPIVLFTLSQNNLCIEMASCDIQKYFMLI